MLIGRAGFTQSWREAPSISTDTVQNIADLSGSAYLFIDSAKNADLENILDQTFVPFRQFDNNKYIPTRLVSSDFYLFFKLSNPSSENEQYHFYPGKNYRTMQLYKVTGGGKVLSRQSMGLKSGFFNIHVAANDSAAYLFRGHFYKVMGNELRATLVADHHMNNFETRMYKSLTSKKVIGILLSGMLLMMIIVALLNFIMNRKKEFLFNGVYSFCMFLLIFLTTYLSGQPGWMRGFFFSFLDLFLLLAGTIFYILFTRYFLESAKRFPRLDKLLKIEVIFLALGLAVFCIMYFGFDNMHLERKYEKVVKLIMLATSLVYIIMALSQKDNLLNFLAVGLALQILFYVISLIMEFSGASATGVFNSPFFYFQVGVVASVLSFLIGLFYKNRHELISNIKEQESLKTAAEKQQLENKLAIYKAQQEERNRISADMHDDLGAGITSIRLYSELAKNRYENIEMPELEKISSSANDLLNNMNAIIWSMSSHNDTLGNMVSYIRSYTTEYLEDTGIDHQIILPDTLPAIEVSGTIRRNVFLVIKEALNNIVKHSAATKVVIEMKKLPEGLSLTIHDNGKGIDEYNIRPHGNGLKNMRERMKHIDVDISIENKEGTLITLYRKTR